MVAGRQASPKDVKNTQKLKTYWTTGPGAAKIGWGTPGDFTRCVVAVRPYLGAHAEGYCNHLHQRAVGAPPGQGH